MAFNTQTGDVLLEQEFQRSDIDPVITYELASKEVRVSFIGAEQIRFPLSRVSLRSELKSEATQPDLSEQIAFFFGDAAALVDINAPSSITPDRTRIAVLDQGGAAIVVANTRIILFRLLEPDAKFIATYFPSPDRLNVLTEDGAFGTYDLSRFAQGNAFDVACNLLPDFDVQAAHQQYPITVRDPICHEDYAPPLPEFGKEASEDPSRFGSSATSDTRLSHLSFKRCRAFPAQC